MLLIIDNFDSFTYNLYQYAAMAVGNDVAHQSIEVRRPDRISLDTIAEMDPSHIILSPGPGRPSDAKLSCDIINRFRLEKNILGVCLGMQCIAEAMGGRVIEGEVPTHGKVDMIDHDARGIFADVPTPLRCVRYHSLIVDGDDVPANVEISARNRSGVVMGLRLRGCRVEGVQFHPEAILTEWGQIMISNFLRFPCTL